MIGIEKHHLSAPPAIIDLGHQQMVNVSEVLMGIFRWGDQAEPDPDNGCILVSVKFVTQTRCCPWHNVIWCTEYYSEVCSELKNNSNIIKPLKSSWQEIRGIEVQAKLQEALSPMQNLKEVTG